MKKLLVIVIILTLTSFSGCGGNDGGIFGDCNCDAEMDNWVENHGNAEEINKYDSEDYHSWTFWYWCEGFSITFTWGKYVDGCCEISTYTFSPICG